jgi:hypothetical protein
MHSIIRTTCVLTLASLAMACATPPEEVEEPGIREGAAPVGPDDAMPTGYPAGPYGTREGSIIDAHDFVTIDEGALSLADLHADPTNTLLLVATSAGWCTACVEEQPILQALHEAHAAEGLVVMVSIFEDADFNTAEPRHARDWQSRHGLSFDVVADAPFVFDAYYDSSLTPMNMIVDLRTMEILKITTGWDESLVRAVIEARL